MSKFVFVHGAWHGAWCWEKVIPLLEAEGHTAVALDMPGHGEDKTPPSGMSLKTYADKICQAVDVSSEPVILTAHSLGGVMATQAAEWRSEKIKALVYVTSFLMPENTTVFSWQGKNIDTYRNLVGMNSADNYVTAYFEEPLARKMFFNLCQEEDAHRSFLRLVPEKLEILDTPVLRTQKNFGSIPRFYIETLQDQTIFIETQRKMQAATPCKKVYTLNADHSPFYSSVPELVAALADIADNL